VDDLATGPKLRSKCTAVHVGQIDAGMTATTKYINRYV
jgi:hypothetical protein